MAPENVPDDFLALDELDFSEDFFFSEIDDDESSDVLDFLLEELDPEL
ncbi:hypothetical protein BSU6633_02344 [Bacillus spizizenii ATCC 6633 = JCM 2499]|nr:hypothetical protein BSU6633_02344 [Bacillus spizizenii ATCC 6633 = JCM 2499]